MVYLYYMIVRERELLALLGWSGPTREVTLAGSTVMLVLRPGPGAHPRAVVAQRAAWPAAAQACGRVGRLLPRVAVLPAPVALDPLVAAEASYLGVGLAVHGERGWRLLLAPEPGRGLTMSADALLSRALLQT